MPIALVTPCSRTRLPELMDCLLSAIAETQIRIVVTTMPDPIQPGDLPEDVHLVVDKTPVPNNINFARWCNLGMDKARELGATEILNMNSDIRLDVGVIYRLQAAMRLHNLAMVGVDFFNIVRGDLLIQHTTAPYGFHDNRISHACFMTPAEQTLRFDEGYSWHYEADDFEYQCRADKGVGIVGKTSGYQPPDTPLSADRLPLAEAGRARFLNKWGVLPW